MLETVMTRGLVDWVWEKRAIFLSLLDSTNLCIRSVQNTLDTATQEGSVISFQPTLAIKGPAEAELRPKAIPHSCSPGLLLVSAGSHGARHLLSQCGDETCES